MPSDEAGDAIGGGPQAADEEAKALLSEVHDRSPSLELEDGGAEAAPLHGCPTPAKLAQELGTQARLWGPLAVNLALNYSLAVINLSFLGHLGTRQLAAASLAVTLSSMCGKLVLMGLCGALDTLASQAYGAGNCGALGVIFQRTVLFLLPHCAAITAAFVALPSLLRWLGQEPQLCAQVGRFLIALLPSLWLDAVNRPLNRILVAQAVTQPQAWVSAVVAVQHVPACYLFIHGLGLEYLGVAWATCWSTSLSVALLAGYVSWAGMGPGVWGAPSQEAFQGWRQFAALAYASAAMRCIESWSFSLCTIASGFLPGAEAAVAAISVAFNLYGIAFMPFAAQSMAVCTRVGNALGAGNPGAARLAALAAALASPATWVAVAALLLTPASQSALLRLFTDGSDPLLLARMRALLCLVVVLELFDGMQVVLSGIVAGAGRQRHGFAINVVAYWVFAVPLAMALGFRFGLGVEGLYGGMIAGPALQSCCYLVLVGVGINWAREAHVARERALVTS